MRKINQEILCAIAKSLEGGPAGSLELKKRVDRHLNRILPLDTFYRYKEISNGLGIIGSKPEAKKVRGGYQTLHSLTERGKKYMALGLNLIDPKKYQYHKDSYEIVSVGDWTDNDDVYRLFLIMASIDTIESAHVEEMYAANENDMLKRVRVLAPTISMKDLVIAGKEKRIDGCVATYYEPVNCLQIWKEEYPSKQINKRMESTKAPQGKDVKANSKTRQKKLQIKASTISVTKRRITFYYIKILGVSASDIINYNKSSGSRRGEKFTGSISGRLSLPRVKQALSLLENVQLISSIGKLNGKIRYTITDKTIRRFIGNCLVIQDQIMDLMNRLWSYRIREICKHDRKWLQMIYGHKKADKIISANHAFFGDDLPKFIDERLSQEQMLLTSNSSSPDSASNNRGSNIDSHNKKEAAIKQKIEESRRRVEEETRALERYIKKEIQNMQAAYANTFKEYQFPLEKIMQLLTLPYLQSSKKQLKTVTN